MAQAINDLPWLSVTDPGCCYMFICLFIYFRQTAITMARSKDTPSLMSASALAPVSGEDGIVTLASQQLINGLLSLFSLLVSLLQSIPQLGF